MKNALLKSRLETGAGLPSHPPKFRCQLGPKYLPALNKCIRIFTLIYVWVSRQI